MADFSRTSRIVAVNEIDQSLLVALKAMLSRNELDIVLLDVIAACRTESVPLKRRRTLRRRSRAHTTGIVLTPTWLLWVTDASGAPVASMCRLLDAEVRRFGSDLAGDVGLEVTGFLNTATSIRSTAFIPVDAGRAGSEFTQKVLDAAAQARA